MVATTKLDIQIKLKVIIMIYQDFLAALGFQKNWGQSKINQENLL